MRFQRRIRQVKRRAQIENALHWFFEPKRKYRPLTAAVVAIGLLLSFGSHFLLAATGKSIYFQLGLGLVLDGAYLFIGGLLVALIHEEWGYD